MSNITTLFALAVAGALVGVYWPEAQIYIGLGGMLAVLGTLGWACHKAQHRFPALGALPMRRLVLGGFFALAFAAPAAISAHQYATFAALRAQLPYDETIVLEGTIRDIVPTRRGGQRWRVAVTGWLRGPPEATVAQGRACVVEIGVHGPALGTLARPDDRVRIRTRLHPLPPQDTPGSFDAIHFGLARSIHARASVHRSADVLFLKRSSQALSFARIRNELRERLLALGTPKEAAILLALLVGETVLFEPSELEMYRRVGAGHLLAVSGLQVSALAWLIYRMVWLCFWCLPGATRRGTARMAASLTTMAAIWGFVALCGAPASVCRAAGMATVILLAPLAGHRLSGFDAIAWTGWFSILWHPVVVLDPSFLLSYAAILGLLCSLSRQRRSVLGRWQQFAIAGLAPGICTAPISVELFGSWSPGGLLANIFLVPAAAILQVPAIALGLFGACVRSSECVHWGAAIGGFLEALCMGMDAPLGGVRWLTAPGGLATAALFGAALVAVRFLSGRAKPWQLVACGCLVGACLWPMHSGGRGIEVTALPVGQGDSLVLRFPTGHVMLVDGGGTYDNSDDPGTRVLLPFFRRQGIEYIDLILVSHPHPDHVLGLQSVLKNLPVGALIHPGHGDEHPLMRKILSLCKDRGVSVSVAREKIGRHSLGEAVIEILAPYPEDGSRLYAELGANDNSLVARILYGADGLLLTGDIEALGELYLLESGVPLEASIVKAPHHGSRTSSSQALVAATKAQHVLFTTGWRNAFGFPHPEVEKRWASTGATLWDTARHGEITFWLTGHGVQVSPYRYPTAPMRDPDRCAQGAEPPPTCHRLGPNL